MTYTQLSRIDTKNPNFISARLTGSDRRIRFSALPASFHCATRICVNLTDALRSFRTCLQRGSCVMIIKKKRAKREVTRFVPAKTTKRHPDASWVRYKFTRNLRIRILLFFALNDSQVSSTADRLFDKSVRLCLISPSLFHIIGSNWQARSILFDKSPSFEQGLIDRQWRCKR